MDKPFKFLGLGFLFALLSLSIPSIFGEAFNTEMTRNTMLVMYTLGVLAITVNMFIYTQKLRTANAVKNK
ncbi:MAG: hypothetical protein JNK00_06680 [Flavipsychrobacter sp.]|nr:hypothetical protein [Flavipsychrobacter sp.]